MKKSSKIIKYAFTAICLVWVIISAVFSERFNIYFSSFGPWIQEGESVIEHFSEDHNVDFELKPGETLSLPITFEKRVSRLGIYLGEQTDSSDKYVFQLEDKYGMILGKAVKALSEIKANDFVYLSSKAIISTSDTYYVKISSESDDKNSAPLNIVVSSAASFQAAPFSVGENESESTLIIDTRYQATRNIVVVIDVILLLIVAVVWLWGLRFIRSDLKEIVIKWLNTIPWKKVNLLAILVLIAANIVLLFFPEKQNMVQCGNQKRINSTEQVISLEDEVVLEQHIKQSEGQINVISVLFATYTQKIKGEKVYLELLDDTNQNIIYSKVIASEEIYDNEYKDFLLPETMDLGSSEYCIRLRSDAASDNLHVAVYLNDNRSPEMYAQRNGEALDYNLIFDMSNQVKVYRFDASIVINGILLILLMLYIWNFIRFKHVVIRSLICSCLLSVLLLPPVLSVLNYRTVSMNGMVSSLWDRSSLSPNREYDKETLADNLTVEKEYDYTGEVHSNFERTEFLVNGFISDVTLEFLDDKMDWKNYDINIYWDTGAGYNANQSYTYQYVHQGGKSVSFAVPCYESARRMMINVGQISNKTIKLAERIMQLKTVKVNELSPNLGYRLLKVLLVYIALTAFSVIIFFCKLINIDSKVETFCERRSVSISLIFVIIASVFGLCFSFLTPTGQVADEGSHILMLYTDIGNPGMAESINASLSDQGIDGIIQNTGRTVDIESYVEASKNKLDDYSFNYKSPSILLIRRPGQAVGVIIGQLLHLPTYWILQLGEIGGLAVYIVLGAITLKIIPYKKNLMMLIMLLPIAIQEAGSFAYDSFTNAVSYLTIAYILYLKVKAQKVGWKQLLPLIPMAICLLLGKVIYVLLLLLIFIVPLDKLELKFGKFILNKEWITHHKAITAISIVLLLCIAAFGGLTAVKLAGIGNVSEMLFGYISSFSQMIRLFATTVCVHLREWVRGITTYYGWVDNPPNDLFMWYIILSAFIFAFMHHHKVTDNNAQINQSDKNTRTFSGANLLVWYGVFVILFCVVQMTMIYWGFFIYGIDSSLPYSVSMRLLPRIEGVGGRYFCPILPLIFIPMHTKKDFLGFIPAWLYKICYFLIAAIFPISLLLLRYWGVGSW